MLTYVIRRLLYSIVVLVAASFLVFTFVTVVRRPARRPPRSHRTSPSRRSRTSSDRKHLDDPIPVRYGYWVQDAVTNQFGTTLLGDRPILPDLWRVMKNTLQLVIVAELLAILIAVVIGVYSALRQYCGFDYTATTFSFLGLATPVFWLALMLQVLFVNIYEWTGHRHLPDREPELGRPRAPGSTSGIDRAQHLALPVIVLMVASIADVLALHARLDARGRQLRLRAHGAREGPHRAAG